MCSRGVFQLRNVKLQFCDWGGSSKGVRELLSTKTLDEFLEKNPSIKFEAYIRTGSHPAFFTEYINGWSCSIPLKSSSAEEVMKMLNMARTRFGQRSISHSGAKVISSNKSIQGVWRPNIWGDSNKFEMKQLRVLPEMPTIKLKDPKYKPKTQDEKIREAMMFKDS